MVSREQGVRVSREDDQPRGGFVRLRNGRRRTEHVRRPGPCLAMDRASSFARWNVRLNPAVPGADDLPVLGADDPTVLGMDGAA